VRLRLTRKLAQCVDGIDLSHLAVGDELDLPARDANLLLAEKWAILLNERRRGDRRQTVGLLGGASDTGADFHRPKQRGGVPVRVTRDRRKVTTDRRRRK
jgi:hypothetical protein